MKKSKYFFITIFTLLMASMILILDISYMASQEESETNFEPIQNTPSIPTEEGVFKRSGFSINYEEMPDDSLHQRNLDEYYDNRAYNGAPPAIPHALISKQGIGGKTCLQCHENGGFVKQFEAYAPVTPHPELLNCVQCHVPQNTKAQFVGSNFKTTAPPNLKNAALPGAPPRIPHALFMRSNCLACHAGPAAPKEIRTTHPLRINCRQCHVPVTDLSTLEWESSSFESTTKIKEHLND